MTADKIRMGSLDLRMMPFFIKQPETDAFEMALNTNQERKAVETDMKYGF